MVVKLESNPTQIQLKRKNENLFLKEICLFNTLYEDSNLTRLQALYWVGHSTRAAVPIFNTIYTFTIHGHVEPTHFERAFLSLAQQSDAFRYVFEKEEGVPQQKLLEDPQCGLEYLDFSEESEPEKIYEKWLQERSQAHLDLETCSYDSVLVKLSNERYIWYLNQHHILIDANSFNVIFQRFAALYERSLNDEGLALDNLPSFSEYITYERKFRESASYLKAEDYWKEKLSPGPEILNFFGSLPQKKTTRVIRKSYDLGDERSSKLRQFAGREGVFTASEALSLYNIFGGMFFTLLHQLSGNHRLGVVTPVHNRFTAGFRNTIGLLIEFSPLQVEISEEDSLISVIDKMKHETRETMGYYQYGSGIALQNNGFDAMFNTYQVPVMKLNGSSVHAKRIHPGHGTESLALHVTDLEATGRFELHFDFHEDVFKPNQQDQVVNSYLRILDQLILDPDLRINHLNENQFGKFEVPEQSTQTESGLLEFDRPGQVPPKDLLEFQILQVWQKVLGNHSIGVNDNFFDMGGNSWLAVKMFVDLEKVTGKYLPLTIMLKAATVAEIANVMRQEIGTEVWSNLITIQEGGDRMPIYFAPGAAENGLAVARIAHYLNQDRPVHMFQIPIGRETTKRVLKVEDMAAHYVHALRSVQPEGPYILGGYSAGGLVALEAAQQLQQEDQEVKLLIIVDVPAQSPNYRYLQRTTQSLKSIFRLGDVRERKLFLFLRDIFFRFDYFLGKGLLDWIGSNIKRVQRFLSRSREDKYTVIRKKFNNSSSNEYERGTRAGSVEEGDQAWMEYDRHMRDHFQAVNEAVKCYVPQYYSGQVLLFRSKMGYRRPEMRMANPLMGWEKIARGGLDAYEIPGNHINIVREPSVELLGKQMEACLDLLDPK
jgi:thioesterase domain-containing protein